MTNFLRSFLLFSLAGILISLPLHATAGGGTNGLFQRMDAMTEQLETAQNLTPEEAEDYRAQIKQLRQKVEQRIKKNGGGLNTQRDKDLYDDIDTVNKPLFNSYQQQNHRKPESNARRRRLGHPQPQKARPNNVIPAGQPTNPRVERRRNTIPAGRRQTPHRLPHRPYQR